MNTPKNGCYNLTMERLSNSWFVLYGAIFVMVLAFFTQIVEATEISNVEIKNIVSNAADISWTTDRDASSEVDLAEEKDYNPKSTHPYSIEQGNPKEATQKHVVNVIGLQAATVYHYSVSSTDSTGLTGTSADGTFETKAAI